MLHIIKSFIPNRRQDLYGKYVVFYPSRSILRFQIEGKYITLNSNAVNECLRLTAAFIRNSLTDDENIVDQPYSHTEGQVGVLFKIYCHNGLYIAELHICYNDFSIMQIYFTEKTINVYVDGKEFTYKSMDFPLPAMNALIRNYSDWLRQNTSSSDYIGMSIYKKSLIIHSHRQSSYMLVDRKNTTQLPYAQMEKVLDEAIGKFERIKPTYTSRRDEALYHQDMYITKTNAVCCEIVTSRYLKTDKCILTIKFRYKRKYVLSFGINIDDIWRDDHEDKFFIRVGDQITEDANISALLPSIKKKYLYLNTVFKLTEDIRSRS